MRTKLVVGLLVLGLVAGGLGAISAEWNGTGTVVNTVTWEFHPFIELTISESAVDFGQIGGVIDTIRRLNATRLHVRSNMAWELSYVVSGAEASTRHLAVRVLQATGNRHRPYSESLSGSNDGTFRVDFTLTDIRTMAPGAHAVTVTYTVTTR